MSDIPTGCTFTTLDLDQVVCAVLPAEGGWQAVDHDGAPGPVRSTLAEALTVDLPDDLVRPDRGLRVHSVGVDLVEVVTSLPCPVAPGGFDLDSVAEAWSTTEFVEWVEGPLVSHPDGTVVQLSTVVTDLGPCLAVWPADASGPGVFVLLDEERGGVAPAADHVAVSWWSEGQMMVSAGSTESGAHGSHVWASFDWSDDGGCWTWLEYVADGSAGAPEQVASALAGRVHQYLRTTVGFPARSAEVLDAGEPSTGNSVRVHGSAEFRRAVLDLVRTDERAERAVAALHDPESADGVRVDAALREFLDGAPTLAAVDRVLAELLGEQPDV